MSWYIFSQPVLLFQFNSFEYAQNPNSQGKSQPLVESLSYFDWADKVIHYVYYTNCSPPEKKIGVKPTPFFCGVNISSTWINFSLERPPHLSLSLGDVVSFTNDFIVLYVIIWPLIWLKGLRNILITHPMCTFTAVSIFFRETEESFCVYTTCPLSC